MGRKNGCPVLVYNRALKRWQECGEQVTHYVPVFIDGRQCCKHAAEMKAKTTVRVVAIEQWQHLQARKRSKKWR